MHQYNCCDPKLNITPTIYATHAKEESPGNDEIDQPGVLMVRLCSWLKLRSIMMWGILSAYTSPSEQWCWNISHKYIIHIMNMFILFQLRFKNVCKITLVTKRALKKLVWRLVASSHTRSHTHTLVGFAPGVPCLSHPGVGKKTSQTSGASKWGSHPGVGKWGKHPGQGWASEEVKYQVRRPSGFRKWRRIGCLSESSEGG